VYFDHITALSRTDWLRGFHMGIGFALLRKILALSVIVWAY